MPSQMAEAAVFAVAHEGLSEDIAVCVVAVCPVRLDTEGLR
jgi:hypothetical protein